MSFVQDGKVVSAAHLSQTAPVQHTLGASDKAPHACSCWFVLRFPTLKLGQFWLHAWPLIGTSRGPEASWFSWFEGQSPACCQQELFLSDRLGHASLCLPIGRAVSASNSKIETWQNNTKHTKLVQHSTTQRSACFNQKAVCKSQVSWTIQGSRCEAPCSASTPGRDEASWPWAAGPEHENCHPVASSVVAGSWWYVPQAMSTPEATIWIEANKWSCMRDNPASRHQGTLHWLAFSRASPWRAWNLKPFSWQVVNSTGRLCQPQWRLGLTVQSGTKRYKCILLHNDMSRERRQELHPTKTQPHKVKHKDLSHRQLL